MKVPRLLFLLLTVSCAALMQERSYAASPQHVSDKNHPYSRVSVAATNRSKQLPTGRKLPLPRNAARSRQPALARSVGPAKGQLIQHETIGRTPPVRSTSIRPRAASLNASLNPLPNNVRHRGLNPAVVGGSANSGKSSTGAINGTGMHRRP
jgi:hypothetical protein